MAHRLIKLIEWLEDEHQRMTTIVATVPVGVSIADSQANTIIYNAAAARMLGVEPDKNYNLGEMTERFAATEVGEDTERRRHGIVRAMNANASHEGRSSHWMSSATIRSGASEATSQRRSNAAMAIRKRSGAASSRSPNAVSSAARCIPGSRSMLARTARRS